MLSTREELRAPHPFQVDTIESGVFTELAEILDFEGLTSGDMPVTFALDPTADTLFGKITSLVQPVSAAAVKAYEETREFSPSHLDISLTKADSGSARFGTNGSWHRDLGYPGQLSYIAANQKPTEFAVGNGVMGLDIIPEKLLPMLVKALFLKDRLSVIQVEEGSLTQFETPHIHRRPAFQSLTIPRISISLRLFSIDYARRQLDFVEPRRFFYGFKRVRQSNSASIY